MTLFYILTATLIISLLSLTGAFLLAKKEALTHHNLTLFISFAAGMMLATSFLDLLPEAFHQASTQTSLIVTLIGIAAFFLLERYMIWHHCHHPTHHPKPQNYLILIGDGVHNFFDGIAIATSFMINPLVGLTASFAIAAHEIPQEIADFAVLVHGGMKPKTALLLNLASALTAVAGAVLGYFALQSVAGLQPILIALTAGMFVYLSLSDLVPELHRQEQALNPLSQSLPFLAAIILTWILTSTFSHSHEDNVIKEPIHPEETNQQQTQIEQHLSTPPPGNSLPENNPNLEDPITDFLEPRL